MQSCGFPNARWDLATRTLTLCYELATEFEDLYRDYSGARADGLMTAKNLKRKTLSSSLIKRKRPPIHDKRKRSPFGEQRLGCQYR
jgi:hypothetical protein